MYPIVWFLASGRLLCWKRYSKRAYFIRFAADASADNGLMLLTIYSTGKKIMDPWEFSLLFTDSLTRCLNEVTLFPCDSELKK